MSKKLRTIGKVVIVALVAFGMISFLVVPFL